MGLLVSVGAEVVGGGLLLLALYLQDRSDRRWFAAQELTTKAWVFTHERIEQDETSGPEQP